MKKSLLLTPLVTSRKSRQTGSEKRWWPDGGGSGFRADAGPYGNHSLTVPCNGPALSLPLYPCDNVDFQVTTYYSNICPNGAYQGMAHER
ncbi:molybdopterin cofactor-binding domain-containing protein [Escherichia coli]